MAYHLEFNIVADALALMAASTEKSEFFWNSSSLPPIIKGFVNLDKEACPQIRNK